MNHPFKHGQRVSAPALGISGLVAGFYYGLNYCHVSVEYVVNGKVESHYFDPAQLVAAD